MASSRTRGVSGSRRGAAETPRALIVEAEAGARTLCRSALRAAGFSVDAVDTGVAGIAIARDVKPDVIVLDFQLRDVSGAEFLKWLFSNPALRRVPIIAIGAGVGERHSSADGQVIAWLGTPLSMVSLRQAIRKIASAVSPPC